MNERSSNEDKRIDFTILIRKVKESEAQLPDLMTEVRRVGEEAEEIRALRMAVAEVSSDVPSTLTLS